MLQLAVLMALLTCAVASAEAATYYVSASGVDTNGGRSPESAWRTLDRVNSVALEPGDSVLFRRGDTWRGSLRPHSGAPGRPIVYGAFGRGSKPALLGSMSRSSPADWRDEGDGIWSCGDLAVDVGNVIFGKETGCGVKVWSRADLTGQGRFWYSPAERRLYLYSDRNPAERYGSVECALYRHIIDESGSSYVTYEGLALKYGGAHGIGGGSTRHITVRDCDISYIGGADQFGGDRRVRFGNGIEFWGNAHDNLVERCRLWEVYDAALTNQNLGDVARQENITYRNNTIWNCEYSFEYWNRPSASVTRNIQFVHNTCVDAGRGWGHSQRPDPSGRHLCFYDSEAQEEGIVVADNVFCDAAGNAFYAPDWSRERFSRLQVGRNRWMQDSGDMMWVVRAHYPMSRFAEYQAEMGQDGHSRTGAPRFRNPSIHDYRLVPD